MFVTLNLRVSFTKPYHLSKTNNGLMEVDWLYYVCLSKNSEKLNSISQVDNLGKILLRTFQDLK